MANRGRKHSSQIVESASRIEKEITAWELRLVKKEEELSELSLHLQSTKIGLQLFLGEYNLRIGLLYVRLDNLRLGIKEYQLRIDLAQGKRVLRDGLKKIEREVSETFAEERENIDELEDEVSEFSEEYRRFSKHEEESPPLNSKAQEELKKLYRKLARKFHPDFAKDDKQREKFNKIMAEINEAYKNGDLETLERYMKQMEQEERIAKETPEEKLSRLKKDYRILLDVLAKLRSELEDLEASETYKLREKVNQAKKEGRDLLQELATNIQEDIDESQTLLDGLISEYKTIIGSAGF
jgi:hypothetical protein